MNEADEIALSFMYRYGQLLVIARPVEMTRLREFVRVSCPDTGEQQIDNITESLYSMIAELQK
jgi:hypothetical protein